MAGGTQDTEEEIVGINVTPLVDIVLVLLIIFMVTANFIVKETIEVDRPRAASGGETLQGLINVILDKEGKLYFDGDPVDEPALKSRIDAALKKDKDTRAIITADQSLSYGKVMHLLDIVKLEGISKFALNIEKEAAPQPVAP